MKLRCTLLVLSMLMTLTYNLLSPSPAYACSGPTPSMEEVIKTAKVIVKGKVGLIDDLNQNGVIQAQQYFKGGPGPEYLLLVRNNTQNIEGVLTGLYGGGSCIGLEGPFNPGESVYLFIERTEDGSYQGVPLFTIPYYRFLPPDNKVTIFQRNTNKPDELKTADLTESEFVRLLVKQISAQPIAPRIDKSYPLTAPLLVTTTRGTQYIMPVDGGPPVKPTLDEVVSELYRPTYQEYRLAPPGKTGCSTVDCIAFSPDGLNILSVKKDSKFYAFRFSSTSETIAMWTITGLEIRRNHPIDVFSDGWDYKRALINKTILNDDGSGKAAALADHSVWSPDGRFLAYSDAKGLWLWDVYDAKGKPRLLLPETGSQMPYARYFSPLGRYLAVTGGTEAYTLDVITLDRLPDGLVSADDRRLLAYDTNAKLYSVSVCSLTPFNCEDRFADTKQVAWLDSTTYIGLINCESPAGQCSLIKESATRSVTLEYSVFGYAFDIEPTTKTLALVIGKSTFKIADQERDLRNYLDGDVASIRWLPSLLYRYKK